MKMISWNVAGFRACLKKGFMDFFKSVDADIFCLQEIKMEEKDFMEKIDNYYYYFNSAEKKGYSGTLVFTKEKPISVNYGMNDFMQDTEGRIITAEYDKFYLVTVYTPNVKRELERLEYRMEWEDNFKLYLKSLEQTKPVILCGDLNVAHNEIDLKNAKANIGNAGFTYEEREKFTKLLEAGFVDTYRHFYPEQTDSYTWWSYMFHARDKNVGWRIDYFVISEILKKELKTAVIYNDILGSDHCPVGIEIF